MGLGWYNLVGRLIEILLADEVREMVDVVRKANAGVKKQGIRPTLLRRIAFYMEERNDYPNLPVPGQRVDSAEGCEEWVENGSDRKGVISVMNGWSESILAKCIGTREEEQYTDSSEVEEEKKPTGDTDDSSDAPLRRVDVVVEEVPPPPRMLKRPTRLDRLALWPVKGNKTTSLWRT